MTRPNVAPRPVCRYYPTARGCFAGAHCHYLHEDPTVAPYEQNKTCRYFARGYCKHGSECWFKHCSEEQVQAEGDAEAEACGICFEEKPALYGLLNGCSHAFCLPCIRRWRDSQDKSVDIHESTTHKTCPMCRCMTSFVTPSSVYYSQDDPRKKEAIEKYKNSMGKLPCRYFTHSKPEKRFCPFGRDCFYQHLNDDGTKYEFAHGIKTMMRQRRRHGAIFFSDFGGTVWDEEPVGIPIVLPEEIADFEIAVDRATPELDDSAEEHEHVEETEASEVEDDDLFACVIG